VTQANHATADELLREAMNALDALGTEDSDAFNEIEQRLFRLTVELRHELSQRPTDDGFGNAVEAVHAQDIQPLTIEPAFDDRRTDRVGQYWRELELDRRLCLCKKLARDNVSELAKSIFVGGLCIAVWKIEPGIAHLLFALGVAGLALCVTSILALLRERQQIFSWYSRLALQVFVVAQTVLIIELGVIVLRRGVFAS
jgi:hypothetical protein